MDQKGYDSMPNEAQQSQFQSGNQNNFQQCGKSSLAKSVSRLQYIGEYKNEKSHDFFKSTRVSSCSYVSLKKGLPKAIPFYQPPKQTYADKMGKSSYSQSLSHETFKVRPNLHTGMPKKPLEQYNPLSYRNRLPIIDAKTPSTNKSQIEIGDRSQANPKLYISTNKNAYGNFGKFDPITNSGILSEKTKWHHKQQLK